MKKCKICLWFVTSIHPLIHQLEPIPADVFNFLSVLLKLSHTAA